MFRPSIPGTHLATAAALQRGSQASAEPAPAGKRPRWLLHPADSFISPGPFESQCSGCPGPRPPGLPAQLGNIKNLAPLGPAFAPLRPSFTTVVLFVRCRWMEVWDQAGIVSFGQIDTEREGRAGLRCRTPAHLLKSCAYSWLLQALLYKTGV